MPQGPYLRKYGVQTTIPFILFEIDGIDFKVDAVDAGNEIDIMKDEGAEAPCANSFTDEGTGYSIVLTAGEMQAARIFLYIVDAAVKAWLDTSVVIETYGHANAQHAVDLDDGVRAGLTALPNAAADAAGGLSISDAGGLDLDGMDTKLDTIDGRIDTEIPLILTATTVTIPGLFQVIIGTPVALDGGLETIAGMLTKMADDNAGADFDAGTDSLQAIRDRGDAAWATGGGGAISEILNVIPLIPPSVDLANTATIRLGLMLTNAVDDLPSEAEIVPGTIDIDRKGFSETSWTSIVNGAACSESAGLVYYDEVFDDGTGYVEGDSIRITFYSQKITVAANDFEITDATGRIFYTTIRQSSEIHITKAMLANKRLHTVSTGVDVIKDDDAATTLRTMTPTESGADEITITPTIP